MRFSKQREVILKILRSSQDHPTADWIYQQARREIPKISLGTIYRNLKQLTKQGLILEYNYGKHPARYESNTGRHHHVRCVKCGRVNDLPLSFMKGIEEEVAQSTDYHVLEHRLEVLGICPGCSGGARRNP